MPKEGSVDTDSVVGQKAKGEEGEGGGVGGKKGRGERGGHRHTDTDTRTRRGGRRAGKRAGVERMDNTDSLNQHSNSERKNVS